MISRMRNRWSFAFPLVVPSKVSAWKKIISTTHSSSRCMIWISYRKLGADSFCRHSQFSKKELQMNFIHQKSFMPKYDISIGSYFFSPARLYTQQQPQPGSHLNSSTGGPCNSGIDFKYRIPAANSIYIHTHAHHPAVCTHSSNAAAGCCKHLLLIFKW